MDPNSYQYQYSFNPYGDPNLSAVPNTAMAPPANTMQSMQLSGAGGEAESSFNDSGYNSSPPASHFTTLSNQLRGSTMAQHGIAHGQHQSPIKHHGSVVGDLLGVAPPRTSWQEDFPNVNDEWEKNFINNFEENLFGFDASDLNTMVDGILASPFKSPMGSPFSSPRQSRSAAAGLSLSPFKNLSTSNIMLAPKRSPMHHGGSPFKSPFSSPSPVSGLNCFTRTSPMTRKRRLILQSPSHQSDSLAGDHFADLSSYLPEGKDGTLADDLGVVPFQRTNSFGFTPHDSVDSSLSSSPPFSSLYSENTPHPSQPCVTAQRLQEINNTTPVRHGKKVKTESMYNLRSSPSTSGSISYKLRSPSAGTSSPTRLAQGRISITRHTQLINELPSKDALRLVRARFKEVLEKASADAVIKEKHLKSKMKSRTKKTQPYPEISQALSNPTSAGRKSSTGAAVSCYTQIQPQKPAGKRRQEILPKPTPDWPRREPCRIAPKKRRR